MSQGFGTGSNCALDRVRLDLNTVSSIEFGFRVFGEGIGEGGCEGRRIPTREERERKKKVGGRERENVGMPVQKARVLRAQEEDGRSQGLKG